jgi:hypothetical protein
MRTNGYVLVLASLCLLSAPVAGRPHDIHTSGLLTSAMIPAQAGPPVKAPDTPSGRALTEFVDSFNAGGQTRQTWLEARTTVEDETRANILKLDAQLLEKYGRLAVVRIVSSSQESVEAVVRHGTSDRHGYLMIAVEPTAPHKVVNIGMRPATPEEIKGGAAPVK